jgi:hypothetical protein
MSAKDYLWSELTRKNPRLLEDPHFTPKSMRKFFDIVYDAGWNSGYKSSQAMPTGRNLFDTFFGGFQ